MQSDYAGENRGEIHGKFRGICPNQGDIRKVSGYPPKSGRYTESFRIIDSSAAARGLSGSGGASKIIKIAV